MSSICEIVPYKKEHALSFLTDPKERYRYGEGVCVQFEVTPGCYSMIYKGVVMACAGIVEIWEGRAFIWTVFNEEVCKTNFVPVIRVFKRYIKMYEEEFNRMEIYIPCQMQFAKRRAELLGFRQECAYVPKFFPDGTDVSIYVKVRL